MQARLSLCNDVMHGVRRPYFHVSVTAVTVMHYQALNVVRMATLLQKMSHITLGCVQFVL